MTIDLVRSGEWKGDASDAGIGQRGQRLLLEEMTRLLFEYLALREAQAVLQKAGQAYQAERGRR